MLFQVPDAKFAHPQGHEAWHEIIKYAEKVEAGLIVIGSRGQGKLKRTFLGSVSDSVLHHSYVPVLVCRNKDAESWRVPQQQMTSQIFVLNVSPFCVASHDAHISSAG